MKELTAKENLERIRTNTERAQTTLDALKVYKGPVNSTFGQSHETSKEEWHEDISDLITNLLHLSETMGLKPFQILKESVGAYSAESHAPNGEPHLANDTVQIIVSGEYTPEMKY